MINTVDQALNWNLDKFLISEQISYITHVTHSRDSTLLAPCYLYFFL